MKRLPGFRYDVKEKLAHFEVCVPGTQGKKRRRSTVEARDVIDATTKYHAFRKAVADEVAGETPAAERTLRWYYEKHWPTMKKKLSDKGVETIESAMTARILPHLGGLLLEKINDAEVGDFVGVLRAPGARGPGSSGYAARTINSSLSFLRKFLRDAVAREVILVYPIKRRLPRLKEEMLRLEAEPAERASFLAAFDDEKRFRASLPDGRHFGKVVELANGERRGGPTESLAAEYHYQRFRWMKSLFVVALETGLRRSDLLGLKWSSVNRREGWIRVLMGKTGEEATIPISQACATALEECWRRRPKAGDRRVVKIQNETDRLALVFVTEDGTPTTEITLKRTFKIAKQLAGIERRFRFHDLRHTFGSTAASQGVSLQVIQKALGHTTPAMTARYARPNETAMRGLADALNRANSESTNSSHELFAVNGSGARLPSGGNPLKESGLNGEPSGTRTQDPILKRDVL